MTMGQNKRGNATTKEKKKTTGGTQRPASFNATVSQRSPALVDEEARRAVPAPTGAEPTHDVIRARAFRISQERGGAPGDSVADWLRAERELCDFGCEGA